MSYKKHNSRWTCYKIKRANSVVGGLTISWDNDHKTWPCQKKIIRFTISNIP